MKDFEKQFVKVNRKRKIGTGTLMLLGLGLIGATGIAANIILSSKSKKIIVSTISKDTKNAIDTMVDKSDEVKTIIVTGYKNINRDLQKVAKKVSN